MDEVINQYLRTAGSYSVAIPIIVGLIIKSKGLLSRLKAWVLGFVILSAIVEIVAYHLGATWHVTNLPLLHVYTILECAIIIALYSFGSSKILTPKIRNILIGAFLLFAVINILFIEGFYQFNANVRAVECVLLLGLALYFFYKIMKDLKVERLQSEPLFWVSVGVLIYFSGNLITFILSNYALISPEMSHLIWGIHALLNILRNVFFAIALWVVPQHLRSPSSS